MTIDGASDWQSIIGLVVGAKIKRIENETMKCSFSILFIFGN